jgi:serine/threonine protein kinase
MSSDFPTKPSPSDFHFGACVGSGALCSVRVATHAPSGRVYAVKMVDKARLKRLCARSPSAPHLLLQEKHVGELVGAAMGSRLHATCQDASSVYFVYDLVAGGELWDACMEATWGGGGDGGAGGGGGEPPPRHPRPLAEPLAAAVVRALVRLLGALHALGVAHRDVKPENVLLRRCGGAGGGEGGAAASLRGAFAPALVDWATAKALSPPSPHNAPGECVGTPEYMAPEAADNAGAGRRTPTDARADLWSLGALAHRLLCGVPPFPARSPFLATLAALAHEAPPASTRCEGGGAATEGLLFAPGTPPAAEAFVRALLRREPAARLGAGSAPPVFALAEDALLAAPWLAATPDTAAGAVAPSLRHAALHAAAAHIGAAPHVPFEQLREEMGGGGGGGGGASWWRAAWAGVRALPRCARVELLHLLALRRRASLPHVFALFCESLGHARCARAVVAEGGALRRLGAVGPREALSWACAPEAVLRAGAEAGAYAGATTASACAGRTWAWARGDGGGGPQPGAAAAAAARVVVLSASGCVPDTMLARALAAVGALRPPPRALVLLGALGDRHALERALGALAAPSAAVLLCPEASSGGAAFAPRRRPPGCGGRAEASECEPAAEALEAAAVEAWGAWLDGARLLFAAPFQGAPHPWLAAELPLAAAAAAVTILFIGGEAGVEAALDAAAAEGGGARVVVAPGLVGAPPRPRGGGAPWAPAAARGGAQLLRVPPLADCRDDGAWWLPVVEAGEGGVVARWERVPDE